MYLLNCQCNLKLLTWHLLQSSQTSKTSADIVEAIKSSFAKIATKCTDYSLSVKRTVVAFIFSDELLQQHSVSALCETLGLNRRNVTRGDHEKLLSEVLDVRAKRVLATRRVTQEVRDAIDAAWKAEENTRVSPNARDNIRVKNSDAISQQFRSNFTDLPMGHAVHTMDYSENLALIHPNEVQSEYFTQRSATLHVTVVVRHACMAVDGIQSTLQMPILVKDYVFVISDDKHHDAAVRTNLTALLLGCTSDLPWFVEVVWLVVLVLPLVSVLSFIFSNTCTRTSLKKENAVGSRR